MNAADMRLLSPDALYALVATKTIELNVLAQVGPPFPAHCTARLLSPNITTVDATVYIDVSMRDAGGFLVLYALEAMTYLRVSASKPASVLARSLADVELAASGGPQRLSDSDNVASLQWVVAGANNASFTLSFRPRTIGTLTFTVHVANELVQYLNVSVLPVRCPAVNTIAEPDGIACICVSGSYFTDEGACVRCPPGTFKPEASRGARPTYVYMAPSR
jgi:hypothetical protein